MPPSPMRAVRSDVTRFAHVVVHGQLLSSHVLGHEHPEFEPGRPTGIVGMARACSRRSASRLCPSAVVVGASNRKGSMPVVSSCSKASAKVQKLDGSGTLRASRIRLMFSDVRCGTCE